MSAERPPTRFQSAVIRVARFLLVGRVERMGWLGVITVPQVIPRGQGRGLSTLGVRPVMVAVAW